MTRWRGDRHPRHHADGLRAKAAVMLDVFEADVPHFRRDTVEDRAKKARMVGLSAAHDLLAMGGAA